MGGDTVLMLYFSGTGNTAHIARLFSEKTGAQCLSIEAETDFSAQIADTDTIAFAYPIYGSRVPRIMREFVARHMSELAGRKLIILVTQMFFSGDGARVFTDMFWDGAVEVIYAEHFTMPNNVGNVPLFPFHPSRRKRRRDMRRAEAKMMRVCDEIKAGVVRKRGFSRFSQLLGSIQGRLWQGDSKDPLPQPGMEERARTGVRIRKSCNVCGVCVDVCPMKNLEIDEGSAGHEQILSNAVSKITHKNNCTVCYRCVNRCPQKAITVLFHMKPMWQYRGL